MELYSNIGMDNHCSGGIDTYNYKYDYYNQTNIPIHFFSGKGQFFGFGQDMNDGLSDRRPIYPLISDSN